MALDGNGHIFVANFYGSNIAEYATSGTVVNASLISFAAPSEVTSLALDGQGHLFVARYSTGTIGEYTTAGAPVHASLITGLHLPTAIALDGQGDLFVSNESNSTIGEYTTSGGVVNASLINLGPPIGAVSLALDGAGHLFTGRSVLGEYTTAGATVNAALIAGLDNPWGLAVTPAPEPSSMLLVVLGSMLAWPSLLRRVSSQPLARAFDIPQGTPMPRSRRLSVGAGFLRFIRAEIRSA